MSLRSIPYPVIVKAHTTGARIATLVAGYNAGDTTNAGNILPNSGRCVTENGTKYIGSTSDSADIVTQLN
jgi:hypothetical protein